MTIIVGWSGDHPLYQGWLGKLRGEVNRPWHAGMASEPAGKRRHDLLYLKYRHLSEAYVIKICLARRLFAAIASQADPAFTLDPASPCLVV
ncbi:hypothetical protein NE852_12215 [Rhizobium sp. Pop5]|uniref:hypothetical protein n=1 Tax=Rhizobium sp. Pop5 TaxID=1223565 RepID=UPI000FFC57CA|nr:hypothetical protein [Rhizobium sp. Pop5]UVD59247.1 hypothetical protein NE852_12215 [Rhizobium sp. Pop5]